MIERSRKCRNFGGEKVSVYARVCHLCGDEDSPIINTVPLNEVADTTTSFAPSIRSDTSSNDLEKGSEPTSHSLALNKEQCDLCFAISPRLGTVRSFRWHQCSYCDQCYCPDCIKNRLSKERTLLIFKLLLCMSCNSYVGREGGGISRGF